MARDFVQGLNVWLIGWHVIFTHPKLFRVMLIPFMLSFLAAIAGIWATWVYYPVLLDELTPSWFVASSELAQGLLHYSLAAIFAVVAVLAGVYAVYVFHALIGVPFYAVLAERTLVELGKARPEEVGGFSFRLIGIGIVKSLALVVIGVLLFVLSFVPGLNILTAAGAMLLLAFDCLDYALEAKRMGLRARMDYALSHRGQWAGIAGGLALTLLVPGLTLLIIPGAVVGAAAIMKDTNR